jgi:O-acetyl-ADP-ribose deacetylase (regulator of RNase III)
MTGPQRYILDFPTKKHWRSDSHLQDIAAGLDSLVDRVRERGIRSLAIPALGCGNGGLDRNDVRPLIEQACGRMDDVRAVVYPPEGAPSPDAMPRPSLTQSRALLLTAISRYLAKARLQEVRDGVSELEIQKLAYFLQVLGAPLRLNFVRGTYGPYAQALARTLDALEGHHLVGLGDRSARVTEFAPVNAIQESADTAGRLVAEDPVDLQRLMSLLDLVEGFETPYSLELLATVHFAAAHEPNTSDPVVLAERVASWSLRKARMFSAKHVALASDRLAERHLLPA